MPNLRASMGKQISIITTPKKFTANVEIEAPFVEDETSSLVISDINIQGGYAKISHPMYDIASGIIPLLSSISPNLQYPIPLPAEESVVFSFPLTEVQLYSYESITSINNPDIKTVSLEIQKINIYGMNYSDKHWHRIPYPEERNPQTQSEKQKEAENKDGLVELKKRGRKSKKKQPLPTIWDLLYAILQPPLAFGQPESLLFPNPLFPYQWEGVRFLHGNEHALLGDDMGTGKTIMTLVALKILIQQAKVRKVLILCPPSVLHQWKEEIEKWTPELTSYLIRHPQRELRKALWNIPMHISITTYDTLRSDIENGILNPYTYKVFDAVVLDEAHHIKNSKTKTFRAIKKLQPARRWALTGTPIQNKIEDLDSIFKFVYPNFLTSFDLSPDRIQTRIKPYFLRRRKKDVMPELPPKIYDPIELELDEDQEEEYRLAEEGIRQEITSLGNKVTKQHIFAKIMLLKQICNFAHGKITSPKTESLKEHIEEIIASGEDETVKSGNKVIVFSQFVDEGVSKLEKVLASYGTAKIVGGQSDAIRKEEIYKFKKRKDIPVLIASVRSGGEGLNLTEASYVVHFDHWWNPAVMWQAEDRVHRRGQTRGVNIYSYWMKDTIDDRIRQKLHEKGILIEQVIEGMAEEKIEEALSIDDLKEILGIKKIEISKKPTSNIDVWKSMSLTEIREKLYEITPAAFEALVKELLHSLGFPNVRVTGKSHDGGIDVLSSRNTERGIERIAAQCKRYRTNVAVHAARDFMGAISNDKSIIEGFLVTTGDFTKEAIQFCQNCGMIRTISGIELARYVKQFGLLV